MIKDTNNDEDVSDPKSPKDVENPYLENRELVDNDSTEDSGEAIDKNTIVGVARGGTVIPFLDLNNLETKATHLKPNINNDNHSTHLKHSASIDLNTLIEFNNDSESSNDSGPETKYSP
jgi:hypothetical protein